MSIRIIDNKRIEITEDEWKAYEQICKSYDDPPAMKGKDLFAGLFETNEEGVIIFLRPPVRACTFEVYLFLMGLMSHQHLRVMHKMVSEKLKEVDIVLEKIEEKKRVKK